MKIPLIDPPDLLYVTDEGACLYHGGTRSLIVKGHKGHAVTALREALDQRAPHGKTHSPFYILADTLAQDFRRDALPPVARWDRRHLAARRLKQIFPQKDLARFDLCGRTEALLTALPSSSPAARWRAALAKTGLPLCGILVWPLEAVRLLLKLAPEVAKGWALFIMPRREGGFRQIVTQDGVLVMTRTTPSLPETSSAIEAGALALDIEASRAYLARFGLHDNTPLHGIIIAAENHHKALSAAGLDLQSLTLLSPMGAARYLRLSGLPAKPDMEDLIAAWLSKPSLRPKLLQTNAETGCHKHYQMRAFGKGAALLALVCCLGTGLHVSFDLLAVQSNLQKVQKETMAAQQALQQAKAQKTPTTEARAQLRLAAIHARLFENAFQPLDAFGPKLLAPLGAEARLTSLSWQAPMAHVPEALKIEVRTLDLVDPLTPPPIDVKDLDSIPTVPLPSTQPSDPAATFAALQSRLDGALTGWERTATFLPASSDSQAVLSNATGTPLLPESRASFSYEKPVRSGTPDKGAAP